MLLKGEGACLSYNRYSNCESCILEETFCNVFSWQCWNVPFQSLYSALHVMYLWQLQHLTFWSTHLTSSHITHSPLLYLQHCRSMPSSTTSFSRIFPCHVIGVFVIFWLLVSFSPITNWQVQPKLLGATKFQVSAHKFLVFMNVNLGVSYLYIDDMFAQ